MVSVFSGEVNRTWRFDDSEDVVLDRRITFLGATHEVSLMHDPFTGARAAMVDHDELHGSVGTTSIFHSQPTTIPFRAGTSCGNVSIYRDKVLGFAYSCFADGRALREATADGGLEQNAAPRGASMLTGAPGPLTARVVGACLTRDHTVATAPITWYLVETRQRPPPWMTGEEEASNPFSDDPSRETRPTTLVHRRFRDFVDLDEAVVASLAGTDLRSAVPHLPSKKNKLLHDHKDPAFVEQRRRELDDYLRRLVTVPCVLTCPAMGPFVGVANRVREYSLVFPQRTLGFTIAKCSPKPSKPGVFTATTAPDFPAYVAALDTGCPPGVAVGDIISKVSGLSTTTIPFRDVITALKHSQRPLMLHFLCTIKEDEPVAPTTLGGEEEEFPGLAEV